MFPRSSCRGNKRGTEPSHDKQTRHEPYLGGLVGREEEILACCVARDLSHERKKERDDKNKGGKKKRDDKNKTDLRPPPPPPPLKSQRVPLLAKRQEQCEFINGRLGKPQLLSKGHPKTQDTTKRLFGGALNAQPEQQSRSHGLG